MANIGMQYRTFESASETALRVHAVVLAIHMVMDSSIKYL